MIREGCFGYGYGYSWGRGGLHSIGLSSFLARATMSLCGFGSFGGYRRDSSGKGCQAGCRFNEAYPLGWASFPRGSVCYKTVAGHHSRIGHLGSLLRDRSLLWG